MSHKTGSISYELETKTFNYDRALWLSADAVDMEVTGKKQVNAGCS